MSAHPASTTSSATNKERVRPVESSDTDNEAQPSKHFSQGVDRTPTSENFCEGQPVGKIGPDGASENDVIVVLPADDIAVHPIALNFRRSAKHEEALTKDLAKRGQLQHGLYCIGQDGSPQLIDGVTRRKCLKVLNKPFSYRLVTEADLDGRSIAEFIHDVNVTNGRELNDIQRAIAVVECVADEYLQEMEKKARENQRGGKRVPNDADKSDISPVLAKRANVKASRIKQVLDLRKMDMEPELMDGVWNGYVSISTALQIAKIESAERRLDIMAKAIAGDKQGVKDLLSCTRTRPVDRFGVSIPESLQELFEQADKVEQGIKEANEASKKLSVTLVHDADKLRRDLAFAMCEWCEWSGYSEKNSECKTCHGKRYLTTHEYNSAVAEAEANIPHVG